MQNELLLSIDFSGAPEELKDDFNRSLKDELLTIGNRRSIVERTDPAELPPGAMSAEAFTIGALILACLPTLLPAILETIKDFKLRNNQHSIKIMVKKGDREISVEMPAGADSESVVHLTDSFLKKLQ